MGGFFNGLIHIALDLYMRCRKLPPIFESWIQALFRLAANLFDFLATICHIGVKIKIIVIAGQIQIQ